MQLTFRPLAAWPYPEQASRPATYRSGYSQTLIDLERELEAIGATEVILGVVADERDVRMDGRLRADAKVRHAGVELSFERPGTVGRVTFHTDRHRGYANSWQDNLRAIVLGLEALRAVDRYGISESGQQYAGFAQLTAGGPDPARGRQLVERAGGIRQAQRAHHPDQGGDQRDFVDVQAYVATLPEGSR